MRTDIELARTKYAEEKPLYERLSSAVASRLRDCLREQSIPCFVEGRAKDEASLLKKMIVRSRAYEDVGDRAGARVCLSYPDDREQTLIVIRRLFKVVKEDDKMQNGLPLVFGYTALHFDVRDTAGDGDLANLICEIQVQTPGEALWAKLNHDLTYKTVTGLPPNLLRAMVRVKALTELIDSETRMVREATLNDPDAPQIGVLATLERRFLSIAPEPPNPELSLEVLKNLPFGNPLSVEKRLATFFSAYSGRISEVYERRRELCFPFLTQPESLLVLMMLTEDAYALQSQWPEILDARWLTDLAGFFSVPLDNTPI